MKITEVIVSAGRTFNHPHEQYSNLRPGLTIKATPEEGETLEQINSVLREKAEKLIEADKGRMIADIINLEEITRRNNETLRLESLIRASTNKLNELREGKTPEIDYQQPDGYER